MAQAIELDNKSSLLLVGTIVLAAMLSAPLAGAYCSVGGCGSGEDSWLASAQSFISSDVPTVGAAQNTNAQYSSFKEGANATAATVNKTMDSMAPKINLDYVPSSESRSNLFLKGELLKPLESFSGRDVIVDVSNQRSKINSHIRGAITMPSKSLLYDNGTLLPDLQSAAILGAAGISQDDAVVVYGDNFSSGEATFVLWRLKTLGHKNVRALDGGLDDWNAASLPMEIKKNTRPQTQYSLDLRPELLADYGYVKSGVPQIVDARGFLDYGKGRITNAFLITPESVLRDGRLKTGEELNDTFAKLDKSRTVVVYSSDFNSASLVWYALQLMGFDTRIYTWQDWQAHEVSQTA
ncbi:Putative thiosulfate sulfurtransferase [uncultured archaeon]|nr:Putative thiosulfate sulfurtransferase [uncultured archaeon]